MGTTKDKQVIVVVGDEDPLHRERFTRALRDELRTVEGVTAEWVDAGAPLRPATKSWSAGEAALLLTLAPKAISGVVRIVEAWLAARATQRLTLKVGDRSIELQGARGPQELEVLQRLLEP